MPDPSAIHVSRIFSYQGSGGTIVLDITSTPDDIAKAQGQSTIVLRVDLGKLRGAARQRPQEPQDDQEWPAVVHPGRISQFEGSPDREVPLVLDRPLHLSLPSTAFAVRIRSDQLAALVDLAEDQD